MILHGYDQVQPVSLMVMVTTPPQPEVVLINPQGFKVVELERKVTLEVG